MKKMYTRTIAREIKQSFGRFVAIIAIVALGVGFLVGLLSSTPDMKASMDQYYSDKSMSDFDIKSTMGLTGDDVNALSDMTEVKDAMPARVTDVLMATGDNALLAGRLYGLELSKNNTSGFINKLTVVKGRMPESAGECVIEKPTSYMSQLSIGDTLTLSSEKEALSDTYRQKNFTIVGIVDNPYYFCNAKEPASVGTGRAAVIAYADSSAYSLETYTDIFLTLKDTKDTFSQEYKDKISQVHDSMETLSEPRIEARYAVIQKEATQKLDKSKKKLAREKKKANQELADAKKELADGQKKLDSGTAQLDAGKSELKSAKAQLADAKAQVKSGGTQLKQAKSQVKKGSTQLKRSREQFAESKKQLDAVKDQVEQAKEAQKAGVPLSPKVLAQIEAYDKGVAQYQQGLARLTREEKKLQKAKAQITANEKKLKKAQQQIVANEKKLKKAESEIRTNEQKLADAKKELADGHKKYTDAKAKAKAEFVKADKKIQKAEKDIENLKKPEWYILDRNSNVSYARYKVDVEKVADVATVFPIFFFLIAALVALTTMTRMVEEERIQIGTLKALGYSRGTIMSKYLIYCGAATALGCLLGLAAGFQLLPAAIYQAYIGQYQLPEMLLQFNIKYALLSCGLEVACTLGATWFACNSTLKAKPAALMIARAPKTGKRIFLERITIIWKHLSFTYKATARNVFRYKKHLYMAIIGIAGCTALMVAGFGMRDSIAKIIDTQYQDILKYDMKIELSEDKSDEALDKFLEGKNHEKISSENAEVQDLARQRDKVSASIYIPVENSTFTQFIQLQDRSSQKALPFKEDSVIMTEKMAEELELSPGETFILSNAKDKEAKFTLTGTTEQYVGSFVYMSSKSYQAAFGDLEYNGILVCSGITDLAAQDRAAELLQDSEYVASSEFTSQVKESYESLLSGINMIVYILILCAGALAVVVLYNLTNININERSRELATLRVLGYHHGEVARYIFREISILSILGTLVGLAAGWVLHRYVILTAESVDFMMGREIHPLSFVLSAIITLAFSVLVDILMLYKLRHIEMVESMKAVD